MTRAEALDAVVAVGGEVFATRADLESFLAMPADEQVEMLAALKLAAKAPPASVWPKLLMAFGILATVASDVTGVAGAVAAIKAL